MDAALKADDLEPEEDGLLCSCDDVVGPRAQCERVLTAQDTRPLPLHDLHGVDPTGFLG